MASWHKLSKVEVRGFTSFRHASVDIKDLNVLIGPNGVGKSNFLALFDMIGGLLDKRLAIWVAEHGRSDRLLYGGRQVSEELSFRLEFSGGRQGYEAALASAPDGSLFFSSERAWGTGFNHAKPFDVFLGAGHTETLLHKEVKDHPKGVVEWTLESLSGWRRYHFHDTSDSARIKQFQSLGDSRFLRRDGRNLAPFLYGLQESDDPALDRIRDAVRSVAPFFDDFILQPDPVSPETIRLQWSHRDSDIYADATMLSDGSLRFMCLAAVLLQPNPPRLILIDEPELGLHPYAIYQLAELLEAAAERCQVVVSTQSVTLLDRISVNDVIVAERVDGATALRRLDVDDLGGWLDEYSIGDLWVKNLIGARPRAT